MPLLHCSETSSSLRGSAGAGKGVKGPPSCGRGVVAGTGVGTVDIVTDCLSATGV